MRYIFLISAGLGGVLLYLLSRANANSAASGQYYTVLFWLNIALAATLIVLIVWQLWRLYIQAKNKVMGSRLTLRLLGTFATMAIIPGLIVYAVSVNFLTRSIESWFNVKVEAALEGGLRLGQDALDIMLTDMEEKAESMSLALAFQPASTHLRLLNELRDKNSVQDAAIVSLQGRIIALSSSDATGFLPDLPTANQLRQARQKPIGSIQPLPGKGLYLRVLAPVSGDGLAGETYILQLLQPVPKSLSNTAESVQDVYRDYQELSFSRSSLKQSFALTLTLVLLLAMLSAVAVAFVLSRRISAPLGVLAEGTKAIASGDYERVLPVQGKDELAVLVQSFNSMTRQLDDATKAANRNRARVEAARGYLETILAHLSSGVLALDETLNLRTFNVAAGEILGADLSLIGGQHITQLTQKLSALMPFSEAVLIQFTQENSKEWQQQIEISSAKGRQILLVRGTRLPEGSERGFVVVFDDITTVAQAQRDAAWAEVARRLAHEIKNPLTPIQLSAERLEHKLSSKLDAADAELLARATHTIVSQVNAMKTMVNEFSEYARAPVLNLSTLDLNQLVRDVLPLYDAMNSENQVKLELHLAQQLPAIQGDTTMLRQVLHNLLQNAHDSLATAVNAEHNAKESTIVMTTFVQNNKVKLSIADNGSGFPTDLLARAFEPYVTTKRHGTGLGLAIVKKMIEEHKGTITIENQFESLATQSINLQASEGLPIVSGALITLLFPISQSENS